MQIGSLFAFGSVTAFLILGCAAPCERAALGSVQPSAGSIIPSFYEKRLDADGIPIVSSHRVPDLALTTARETVNGMLRKRPDIRRSIMAHHGRVAIIARSEVTTHLPEYADIYEEQPGEDWNVRARGLGATVERPVTSAGAENVLCSAEDIYHPGQNTLVHELAHTIHKLGLELLEPSFNRRLDSAYRKALSEGKWASTYAATHVNEYWAEGALAFFDAKRPATANAPEGDRVRHREELRSYDPELYGLLAAVFVEDAWRPHCAPTTGAPAGPSSGAADQVSCSPHTATPMNLRIVNHRNTSMEVFWVSEHCEELPRGRIEPGAALDESTFESHRFRLRDAVTHSFIIEIVAQPASTAPVMIE
jgi:hypothetical protein